MPLRHRARLVVLSLAFATATVGAQTIDRSKPPGLGPAPSLKLPAIQKRQLTNGLPVWIVELHEVPVAQVNLVVPSGAGDDPSGKYGVASLTAAMLMEGAGSRSSLEIADAIDFLGAELSASSTVDYSAIRLHVPVARLAEALPIMADVAERPTFPADELERLRQQRIISLLQARDDPATIASLAFSRTLYGPGHRYGTATAGTADSLKGFTRDDLVAFYASVFRPDNTTLLVVGDVVPDAVMPLMQANFGTWKAPATPALQQKLTTPDPPARREIYMVDKPGAAQSQIRIGTIGVPRSTPDYYALQVLNTILGGAFSSRLNLNLREKHGYSYGASSSFDMRKFAGPFSAFAGVQTDKTMESLQEFFNELNGILQPVPAEELTRAKNYVALRFPLGFETTGDISSRLENAIVYRLPDDYFEKFVANIQAVSAEDVQRVARKYIQPERLAVFVVGDKATIESRIRTLNLGPIRELTIDEVFAPAR